MTNRLFNLLGLADDTKALGPSNPLNNNTMAQSICSSRFASTFASNDGIFGDPGLVVGELLPGTKNTPPGV